MHQLLEQQNTLHAHATELLDTILLPILKGFGEVTIGGSYVYELMSWPDIDIGIQSEVVTKETYIPFCTKLLLVQSESGSIL